jgi:hypothetical protein
MMLAAYSERIGCSSTGVEMNLVAIDADVLEDADI